MFQSMTNHGVMDLLILEGKSFCVVPVLYGYGFLG